MDSRLSQLSLSLLCFTALSAVVNGYDLAILHTNDVLARVDPINKYGGPCPEGSDNCFGGFPRLKTKVKELRGIHGNTLLLDGGDMLTGSTWFFKFGGAGMATFMNYVGYDAMVLGNHEFAKGDKELIPFLDGSNFTVLSANIKLEDDSPLAGKFLKSHVVIVGGERLGLIGYTLPITREISNPGDHVSFHDEVEAVKREVAILQQQNVNKIIVLGHSGFEREMEVAALVEGIDIIVGGHNNKFFYNGDPPSNESPDGGYPQVVIQASGAKVLVVHNYAYAKYLGEIHLVFDQQGVITSWYGNPLLLDNSVREDADMLRFLAPYKATLVAELDAVVGRTHVFLEGSTRACRSRECNLGNLIADSYVRYNLKFSNMQNHWNNVSIALVNSGSIRASLTKGDITLGLASTVLPFGNSIDLVEMYGKDLLAALEHSVSEHDWAGHNTWGGFMQVSGLKIKYDLFQPKGSRVVSARALCTRCDIPRYEDIRGYDTYQIIISSFIAKGGDRYSSVKDGKLKHIVANYLDLDIFVEYLKKYSPVIQSEEDRIVFVNPDPPCEVTWPTRSSVARITSGYLSLILLLALNSLTV